MCNIRLLKILILNAYTIIEDKTLKLEHTFVICQACPRVLRVMLNEVISSLSPTALTTHFQNESVKVDPAMFVNAKYNLLSCVCKEYPCST